jgi:Zn finger protein HypA/HybF involved in hydrogenase expression
VHELSVAEAIERAALAARPAGAGRLVRARVVVGELASLEPELLLAAWRTLAAAGAEPGATLEIEWRPARQTCAACGEVEERRPGTWLRTCPFCRGPLALEGGGELDLVQLEFEAAGEAVEESR